MPEYYLTNSEFDILSAYKEDIIKHFEEDTDNVSLIELGAGDGKKTKIRKEIQRQEIRRNQEHHE